MEEGGGERWWRKVMEEGDGGRWWRKVMEVIEGCGKGEV